MDKAWQWFLANGDKLLAFATAEVALLQSMGALNQGGMKYATVILASLTLAHNTFLPEPKEITK
jgi:hypothetical protein